VDAELRQEAASGHLLRPHPRDEEVRQNQGARQIRDAVHQNQGVRRVLEDHRAAFWWGAWDDGHRVHPGMAAGYILARLARRSLVHRRDGRDRRSVFRAEWRPPVAGGRSRWEPEPVSQVEAAAPGTPDAVRSEA
jgi:hypothetical protein